METNIPETDEPEVTLLSCCADCNVFDRRHGVNFVFNVRDHWTGLTLYNQTAHLEDGRLTLGDLECGETVQAHPASTNTLGPAVGCDRGFGPAFEKAVLGALTSRIRRFFLVTDFEQRHIKGFLEEVICLDRKEGLIDEEIENEESKSQLTMPNVEML
jgi:hypothetical protein